MSPFASESGVFLLSTTQAVSKTPIKFAKRTLVVMPNASLSFAANTASVTNQTPQHPAGASVSKLHPRAQRLHLIQCLRTQTVFRWT
mmetsp:Transcript_28044/g.86888  ORF Transcript_28044/g.86888 Transcript_28044/m.86888 type:complete len:87 (-) Transcript_28044:147-407(-)